MTGVDLLLLHLRNQRINLILMDHPRVFRCVRAVSLIARQGFFYRFVYRDLQLYHCTIHQPSVQAFFKRLTHTAALSPTKAVFTVSTRSISNFHLCSCSLNSGCILSMIVF